MKKKLRKFKKFIYSHQVETIIAILSFIICIIGTIAVGWFIIPFIVLIDLGIFYWPQINKWLNKLIKKIKKTEKEKKESTKEKITVTEEKNTISEKIKDEKIMEGSNSEVLKKSKNNKIKEKISKVKKTKNKVNKTKKEKKSKKNILKIIVLFILIGIIVCFVGAVAFWLYIVKVSPKFNENNLYKKESTILYDKDGKVFTKIGTEFREKISYEELPEVLVNAIIATEDSRFFQHNGFDLPRFAKATLGQIAKKLLHRSGNAGGASTLTMQIAKNAFNGTEDEGIAGIIRKFKDINVSINEIEKNYTKEQIIEFYTNSYLLGGNVYGVEQAARTYFGKNAKDLNLSEAAIIAGLFQSPNAYNPVKNPKNATYRRGIVLKLMVRHGYITQEEADMANAIPVENLTIKTGTASKEPYQGFIDTVVAEVKKDTGKNPYTTSMEIYTTMDRTKQDIVNAAMKGETYQWENSLVDGGVSVLNSQNGELAAVGIGRNTDAIGLRNNATFQGLIKPQIGSTAKPLYDYGPAIEYTNLSPYDYVGDEIYAYSDGTPITNWDGGYQSLLTSRQALSGSRNIPALKTFQKVKNSNILEFVKNLGLSPEAPNGFVHEAHAIGGYNGESPVTISAAYAAIANGGTYNEPHSYRKVIFRDTKKEIVKKYASRKAMKDSTSFILYDMLVTTSQEAMRSYRYINGWKYGAKTGTSNFSQETKDAHGLSSDAVNDFWCTGVTDEYSISVWYGYDKIYREAYSRFGTSPHIQLLQSLASKIWTRGANQTMPDSVVSVTVEAGNIDEAKLPSKYTPADQLMTEYFVKGSEPTEVSTRFNQLPNVKNLKYSYGNGKVKLEWDKIATPNGLNRDYLDKYFNKLFTNYNWRTDAVNNRFNYYNSTLGGITYYIYEKKSDGLKFIGSTVKDEYQVEISSSRYNPVYVVKTTWAKYDACISNGAQVTANLSTAGKIITYKLSGSVNEVITKGTHYSETVNVLENDVPITGAIVTVTIYNDSKTITYASNQSISNASGKIATLASGNYVLVYTVKYAGNTKTLERKLTIKES